MPFPRQHDCLKLFGNPFVEGFAARNLVYITPPFAMSMGNIHIPRIQVNKIASEAFLGVLNKIADECGHDQTAIQNTHASNFSGSFNPRQARGLSMISMHAYGLAIDLDAPNNPLGAPEAKTFFKSASLVVRLMKEAGIVWGGDWKSRRDAMHFQCALL